MASFIFMYYAARQLQVYKFKSSIYAMISELHQL